MKSELVKLPIGSIEIPSSIIDMINGKGQFVILNHFFKEDIKTESIFNSNNIFEDKDVTGSKANVNISGIFLLYRRPETGLYTQQFVYRLSNSDKPDDNEIFTFRSPYTESIKRKKNLECKPSNGELSMKVCKFENIIMYTLEFLLLAELFDIPKELIRSAHDDKELINNFFKGIYSTKSKEIHNTYLSERYYDCLRNPPIWIKDDKKYHIQPIDNELNKESLDIIKYCTLSEVLYKTIPEIKRKELQKKHSRFYKYWFASKQLIIPQTKRIVYEKKQTDAEIRSGESPKYAEYLSNVLKFIIKFDKTPKNLADNLAKQTDKNSMFCQFATNLKDKSKRVIKTLEYNDYISLYNGKIDFRENEPVDTSMQTWSGKIVCKIEFSTILFSLGYPKIESNVKCLAIDKAELQTVDDYADIIGDLSLEIEPKDSNETKDKEEHNEDIDPDEF